MMECWNAGMMGEERIKNTEDRRQNEREKCLKCLKCAKVPKESEGKPKAKT
jgi:hypothetical protein